VWEGAGGGSGIGGHVIRHRQAPANQKLARVLYLCMILA
jgi:hypothetical protein